MVLYVEKKKEYRNESNILKNNLKSILNICVDEVRIIEVYSSKSNIHNEDIYTIFSNRLVDDVYFTLPRIEAYLSFRVESIPTQFNQRKYWANKLLNAKMRNMDINYSRIYCFKNLKNETDIIKIKKYIINPLELYEKGIDDFKDVSIKREKDLSFQEINVINDDLKSIIDTYNLSMSIDDLKVIQEYFLSVGRNPNYTELKMLDTYWSDHCRHTTFSKIYKNIDFSKYNIKRAKEELDFFKKETNKNVTLMNLALFPMKYQKKKGNLTDLDESDEINAATIVRRLEDKNLMLLFKNETHNHPTEIEPFGGASTCIGGAIRDPLSGRAYVYQSMRITGAKEPFIKTLNGKLPQAEICRKSAHGYSSYGNEIGLNTGYVNEYYHDGFEAKRLELGFVIGVAKQENVKRLKPKPNDLLILLGGKTGIDGIGGASGSSKLHKKNTTEISSCEVQKGNAPEERKIQRVFKHPEFSKIIKKCNDLGAGGISVAFGEIADGIEVELSKVHLKYLDIFASEIFLSESQERMALVIDKNDLSVFNKYANLENLEYSVIGKVIEEKKLLVKYNSKILVDISREFLDLSGAKYYVDAKPEPINFKKGYSAYKKLSNNENLMRMFDSSIGAKNVLNPYGGKNKLTRTDGMVSIIPYTKESVSIVTHDYDPNLSSWSPFHGGYYAVINSVLKNIAFGSELGNIRLTFQEYFETLRDDKSYAKPLLSLLGANSALRGLSLASIGGKDSMSGTYKNNEVEINVPPTLVSFAVNTSNLLDVITNEFKKDISNIVVYSVKKDNEKLIDIDELKNKIQCFSKDKKKILSASAFDSNIEEVLTNMGLGNDIGYDLLKDVSDHIGIVAEVSKDDTYFGEIIGYTSSSINKKAQEQFLSIGNKIYSDVYKGEKTEYIPFRSNVLKKINNRKEVKVFIPIFEGTNCEFDVRKCFEKYGAEVYEFVFTNDVEYSLNKMEEYIDKTDILALVGGFSAADEPDGSAKFISNIFRTKKIKNAFDRLIQRDGLVIGICNGFQALVNLGVFNNDKIEDVENINYTLTYNKNMTHIADYVDTKIVSNASYFLRYADFNKIYKVPISHGEGRFIIDKNTFDNFKKKGQIFSVYLNNPNGSFYDVEGIISPSGKILGKMAHNERVNDKVAINIYNKNDLLLFKSAIDSIRRIK